MGSLIREIPRTAWLVLQQLNGELFFYSFNFQISSELIWCHQQIGIMSAHSSHFKLIWKRGWKKIRDKSNGNLVIWAEFVLKTKFDFCRKLFSEKFLGFLKIIFKIIRFLGKIFLDKLDYFTDFVCADLFSRNPSRMYKLRARMCCAFSSNLPNT